MVAVAMSASVAQCQTGSHCNTTNGTDVADLDRVIADLQSVKGINAGDLDIAQLGQQAIGVWPPCKTAKRVNLGATRTRPGFGNGIITYTNDIARQGQKTAA